MDILAERGNRNAGGLLLGAGQGGKTEMIVARRTTHPKHSADAVLHLPGREQPALCGNTGKDVHWDKIEVAEGVELCKACLRKLEYLNGEKDAKGSE